MEEDPQHLILLLPRHSLFSIQFSVLIAHAQPRLRSIKIAH